MDVTRWAFPSRQHVGCGAGSATGAARMRFQPSQNNHFTSMRERQAKNMTNAHSVHVMFDTNSVFTENMQHVFCRDAETLVQGYSMHPGITTTWVIPAMVRAEREWQMRCSAGEQLAATRRMQKLFGQTWVEDENAIGIAVTQSVDRQLKDLQVDVVECDIKRVDWESLIASAARRLAPFSPDKSEKGFRDAIIL